MSPLIQKYPIILAFLFSLLLLGNAHADPPDKPLAQVSQLEGSAWRVLDPSGKKPLSSGAFLKPGDCIQTGKAARLAMVFHDGNVIRLNADTKVVLNAEKSGETNSGRHVLLTLKVGELWGLVMNRNAENKTVAILTRYAFAALDEGVFRIEVLANRAAIVKVYRGQVVCGQLSSQTPWRHQVMPMRELIIRKDGSVTNPFRFAAKADRCNWVLWNQALDAEYPLNN